MRGLFGASVRRTGVVCLVAGFLSGLLTMNIFGRGSLDRRQGARQVVLMQQQLEGALVDGGSDHRWEDGDHGHLHEHGHAHDHAHDDAGYHEEKHSDGGEDHEDSIPTVDAPGSGSNTSSGDARPTESCTYTWTAVAHRHVIGGQHDPQSHTVADCQAACVNRTDCSGVDFNNYRDCFLIIVGSSGTTDFHHHDEEKHEEELGCVHYDLMKSCGSAADDIEIILKHSQVHTLKFPTLRGHLAADDDTIAQAMNRAVRVLCWVMTTPENHMSKAVHIQATWGRRCTKLLFVTEKDDVGALSAVRVEVQTGREHLTAKTMSAFQHLYEHHIDDAEWFLKADDDTYVIMENLRYFLSSEDPSEPVYFGHHFKVIVEPQGYLSGGAGYVISKEALTRFGKKHKGLCRDDDGAEDVEIGDCMQKLGVRLGDSRDALGRSRFHCFGPETHIHGGYPDWYLQYDKYGAQKGIETISDYAISFHYIPVEQLYNLEFYVYHLRPYGVISGIQDLNRHDRVVQKTTKRSGVSANSAPLKRRKSPKTSGSDHFRLTPSPLDLV